jgi:dCMP deaminase
MTTMKKESDMPGTKWDLRFLQMASLVGSWSKDPSTKVGAVIADSKNRIVSVGYNGLPRGVEDKEEFLQDRAHKYPRVIHAEINAIVFAKRELDGCTLYATAPPCSPCASKIVQTGIRRIVAGVPEEGMALRWAEDFALAALTYADTDTKLIVLDVNANTVEDSLEVCSMVRSKEVSGEDGCALYRDGRFGSQWCMKAACGAYEAWNLPKTDYRTRAWAERFRTKAERDVEAGR